MDKGKNYYKDAESLHKCPVVSGMCPLAEFIFPSAFLNIFLNGMKVSVQGNSYRHFIPFLHSFFC